MTFIDKWVRRIVADAGGGQKEEGAIFMGVTAYTTLGAFEEICTQVLKCPECGDTINGGRCVSCCHERGLM